jgi:hypothetical protein
MPRHLAEEITGKEFFPAFTGSEIEERVGRPPEYTEGIESEKVPLFVIFPPDGDLFFRWGGVDFFFLGGGRNAAKQQPHQGWQELVHNFFYFKNKVPAPENGLKIPKNI